MGQQLSPGKEENVDRRKQIENYWKATKKGKFLRESQDNRIVRKFFDMYDTKGKGKLEGEDAIAYIEDLLKISGFDKEIMKEAKAQKTTDPKSYYDAYVLSIFHEMDPNMTGAIEFEQLIEPKFQQWMDFLLMISTKGAREREFLRKLRDRASKKSSSEKKDEDDIRPEEYQKELEAIDSLWQYQLEEDDEDDETEIQREILTKDRRSLTTSGVARFRERQIVEVTEILQIDPVIAQALMQFMKWDKEKLLAAYFNDKEKLFHDAGLPLPRDDLKTTTIVKKHTENAANKNANVPKTIECTICFETVGEDEFTGLEACRHYFCNNCWKTNLTEVQIKEGHTIDITCMHKGCNNLVPADVVKKLVDAETYKKYATFLSKAFVEHNTEMRWCPKTGCDRAVVTRTKEGKIFVGKCSCGYQFCWSCMNEAHPPITCKMLKDWIALATGQTNLPGKGVVDPSTLGWIAENTKDCPKCGTSIEKNSGCFMMTCSQCGAQWCWMCSQPWSTHRDHFRCSKYRDAVLEDKPHFSKEELEQRKGKLRHAFFYKQYMNHDQSLKLEEEHKRKVQSLMEELTTQMSSVDPTFIEEAFLQLQECRLSLKYSYVYLYFEEDELNKAAYEIVQSNLEMVTERLGQALNRPVKEISGPDIRSLTKVALKALVALLTAEPLRGAK